MMLPCGTLFSVQTTGKKHISSIDVAKAAGVSQSAVSRAFTPNGRISAKTRDHILKIATELGYSPNALARSLVKQHGDLVAVLTYRQSNPFYDAVLHQLAERLQQEGKQALFLKIEDESNAQESLLIAKQYRVQAVIMMSITLTSNLIEQFSAIGVPVILFNRYQKSSTANFVAVSCDNFKGGQDIAENLLAAGHKRFAFIGGKPNTSTNQDRRDGFIDRLGKAGIDLSFSLEREYSYDWGCEAVKMIYGNSSSTVALPDAIFCANDTIALGVLDTLKLDFNKQVPTDVSVVGFDDIPTANFKAYELSTVQQPLDKMMAETLQILKERPFDSMSGPDIRFIEGEFIQRESSKR